jgi:hypothetical protein
VSFELFLWPNHHILVPSKLNPKDVQINTEAPLRRAHLFGGPTAKNGPAAFYCEQSAGYELLVMHYLIWHCITCTVKALNVESSRIFFIVMIDFVPSPTRVGLPIVRDEAF